MIWPYIVRRLLLMVPTVLGVLTLTFAVIQFVPGGPVEQMLYQLRSTAHGDGEASGGAPADYNARRGVDPKQLAELRTLYGFDRPPLERYWTMLKRFARFDLGQAITIIRAWRR